MDDRSKMEPATCGRLCEHRSIPEYPGGSVSAPYAGCTYRIATVPYDWKTGEFDEGARAERLIEILSVDGITDACLGDEVMFTGCDRESGERTHGTVMIGSGVSGSRAMYGIRAIAEMSCVSDPADRRDAPAGDGLVAACAEITPDALPDVCLMAKGRKYDLTVVSHDGSCIVLHGASRHVLDRRCSFVDGSRCGMEFQIDLEPEDADALDVPGGRIRCRVEMAGLDGRDIRMVLGSSLLDDGRLEAVKVAPVDGDAARDAAVLMNRQLRTFARLKDRMLALSGGRQDGTGATE